MKAVQKLWIDVKFTRPAAQEVIANICDSGDYDKYNLKVHVLSLGGVDKFKIDVSVERK